MVFSIQPRHRTGESTLFNPWGETEALQRTSIAQQERQQQMQYKNTERELHPKKSCTMKQFSLRKC